MSLHSNMSLRADLRSRSGPRHRVANYMNDLKNEAESLRTAVSEAKNAQILQAVTCLRTAMRNIKRVIAAMTDTGEITLEEVQQYNREATEIYEDAVATRDDYVSQMEAEAKEAMAAKEAKEAKDHQRELQSLTDDLDEYEAKVIEQATRMENKMKDGAILEDEEIEEEIDVLEIRLLKVKEAADDLEAIVRPSDAQGDQAKEAVDRAEKEVTRIIMEFKKMQQSQAAMPFGSSSGGSHASRGGQGVIGGAGRLSHIVRGGGGRSRSSFKKNYDSSQFGTSKSQFGSTISSTVHISTTAGACSQGSSGDMIGLRAPGAWMKGMQVDVTRCTWTPLPRTKKVSKTNFKPRDKMFPPSQRATKSLSGKVDQLTSLTHNSVPPKVEATAGKLRLGIGKFGSGRLISGKVAHKRDQTNATISMATILKLRWGQGAPMSFPMKRLVGTEAPRSCASCKSCKCAFSEEPLSRDVAGKEAVAVIDTVAIEEKPPMEHSKTLIKKWRVCAVVCLFLNRLRMTTKTVRVAVTDGQEVKSGPPSGFLQMPEDYLVEEAQKDLITNEKGQEALEPLANENGQEAEKTVAIKNGQEVTSVTSPGCQQMTESNLKEVDLVNLNTMKLSNFIPIYKKVMELLEGQIPLWAVGGHIMAKMKVPILDHSSPKPSCSCKKLTHEMVARTAWC